MFISMIIILIDFTYVDHVSYHLIKEFNQEFWNFNLPFHGSIYRNGSRAPSSNNEMATPTF